MLQGKQWNLSRESDVAGKTMEFSRTILLNGNTAIRRFNPRQRRVKSTLRFLKATNCTGQGGTVNAKECLKSVGIKTIRFAASNLVGHFLINCSMLFRVKQLKTTIVFSERYCF